jgi:hypothetical protein
MLLDEALGLLQHLLPPRSRHTQLAVLRLK